MDVRRRRRSCRRQASPRLLRALGVVLPLSSCGGEPPGGAGDTFPPGTFLAGDRLGELPESLAELGLSSSLVDGTETHGAAIPFAPAYPLWTNGATKRRSLLLPAGKRVDTSAEPWSFPPGTVLAKTFFYPDESARPSPVETRILRRGASDWDYAVYLWNEDARDATLLDGRAPVSVPVTLEGESFDHLVPSRLQCRSCHESRDGVVLGFDAFRLDHRLEGESETQLDGLRSRGALSHPPPEPGKIAAPDELTRSVLGYFEGNCTHCHNGGDGPASAFSLRHEVALQNLIDVEATSELVGGIRVRSGDPEQSGLFLALSRADVTSAQPMPPLGVERVDAAAVEMFRSWITGLTAADETGDPRNGEAR